jgi:hypothetical protein
MLHVDAERQCQEGHQQHAANADRTDGYAEDYASGGNGCGRQGE